jgi:hypothetical protein
MTEATITVAVIPVSGGAFRREIPRGEAGLRELQELVGGYIEVIAVPALGIFGYINEDGKRLAAEGREGFEVNTWATQLARIRGDVVVGTMVLFGPPDANTDETSVPEGVLRQLGV